MSGTTTLEFWQLFLLTLSPAIVAAVVGIFAPRSVERERQKAEKRRQRVEKFEEFVTTLYEHLHWTRTLLTRKTSGSVNEITSSPIAKAFAISTTYFPEFDLQLKNLDLKEKNCYAVISKIKSQPKEVMQMSTNETVEIWSAYLDEFYNIMGDARRFDEKEFS
ncbi:hypothetical protein [Pikeienuella sp. HZG-20]|uniref:hypothetical protein n=1 Tax=Paludibacillus litoralis TaxID=3133267 RepID=UPI0030EC4D40